MAAKGKNKDAAWELVKFLSSPAFANAFGAHYGWAPVRSDVDTARTKGSDPQVQRINGYVLKGWDGLPTGPKMAQLTDVYGQAIEAAATGKQVGQGGAGQGADGRHRDPQELTVETSGTRAKGGCRRKRQRRPGTS